MGPALESRSKVSLTYDLILKLHSTRPFLSLFYFHFQAPSFLTPFNDF